MYIYIYACTYTLTYTQDDIQTPNLFVKTDTHTHTPSGRQWQEKNPPNDNEVLGNLPKFTGMNAGDRGFRC